MPTFCRHNRLVENCPICSKKSRVGSSPARSVARREPRAAGAGARAPRRSTSSGLVVRRMARAAEDGYEHDLVPGLRASADAARLADELAFSAARLRQLSDDPPGLYAEAATAEDREEAAWLAFLITFLSPLEGADDPFANIRAVRTSWASGEIPALEGAQAAGPRGAYDVKRGDAALVAYRAWAQRHGGQVAALAGEETWTPQNRYDRAFERLGLPGFGRPHRLELLAVVHRLGIVDLDPWTLHLGSATPTDPVAIAAKRILGIGDPVLLQRRQRELAHAVGVPVESLDLALYNWSAASPEARVRAGATVEADPVERARIGGALGV